jgi:hypothetical protein
MKLKIHVDGCRPNTACGHQTCLIISTDAQCFKRLQLQIKWNDVTILYVAVPQLINGTNVSSFYCITGHGVGKFL